MEIKINPKPDTTFSERERQILTRGGEGKMQVYLVSDSSELQILRTVCEDISPEAPLLPLLIRRMLTTVRDTAHAGVGLAAPQVGILKNIILVQRFDQPGKPFEAYLNPRIIWYSQLIRTGAEGCLSIPDRRHDVERSYAIRLRYQTPAGDLIEENIEGFTAVIFQHEVDHLHGILYPDRLQEQEVTPAAALPPDIRLSQPATGTLRF